MADSNDRFVRVPYELWDDTRLTGSEKLVMIALFRHQNWEQRRSWPSQELIAKECGLSRLWVRKILSELERRKYIVCEKGHGRNKQYAICPLPPPDVMETQLPIQDGEQWKLSNHVMETHLPSNGNSVSSNGNSVSTNKIKNKITNKMNEQEQGDRKSPDPWTRDRLADIRKVVTAPRPGNLPALLAQWRETYGAQTVEETIHRALRWMQDNGRNYSDMGRFIGNWLARDAERQRARPETRVDYGDTLPSWEELLGGRQ